MIRRSAMLALGLLLTTMGLARAGEQVLSAQLHHLRVGDRPEWSDFPEPAAEKLELKFPGKPNSEEWTLIVRQYDVRDSWKVSLNGREIGRLQQDENDMLTAFRVLPGVLQERENRLVIEQNTRGVDDIRVGDITLHDASRDRVLGAGTVEIQVRDVTDEKQPHPTPCRLTVLNQQGSLVPIGAVSNDSLAVRTGVVYTSTGQAQFNLPAGDYTISAGRGFEYGVDAVKVSIHAGDVVQQTLSIRREIPTDGWVSCDTHVHTLTHSGHGDCTLQERMITLAGEGIELPIATDHNVQIDYQPIAEKLSVQQYFTPVVGNEVTTSVGHFNVFPLSTSDPVPDSKAKDWQTLFKGLLVTDRPRIIILNHARDIHANYRPFGPEHHIALTGENIDGWQLRANGMEIINSGAQQTDSLQLTHDWMGLLNRGLTITPVGSSDSHDVSRYIVGQGRTYIRCRDNAPGDILIAEAVDSFLKGEVMVSCGLLTEITVNDRFGPGAVVSSTDDVQVSLRVLGPSWVEADTIQLFANGRLIKEVAIQPDNKAGVKWAETWKLPRFSHDVHLVAVASGPGVTKLSWPIARPYQPTSPVVKRRVIGVTGAIWIDGDGDGKRSSAADYAERLWTDSNQDVRKFVDRLQEYDEVVQHQAASLLKRNKISATDAAKSASPVIRRAFQTYEKTWRESQVAKAQ